jgi:hypothetical protein
MMVSPGVFALTASSAVAAPVMIYASGVAVTILRGWDLKNGSEKQLRLERRTFLVSTVVNCVMAYQVFALFMFVYTTDHLHGSFIGTMCAAGTLNVNLYGYPTLNLKLANAVLCGLWIVLNHTDNQAFDYPLIRFKYKFLLLITGLLLLETFLQWRFLTGLEPDIISSCCGILFGETGRSLSGGLTLLPSYTGKIVFYLSAFVTLRVGIHFLVTQRMGRGFSMLSIWLFLVSLVSVISFISLYYYELPTHHCPFCLLQREYHFIGYPLYISLFTAAVSGASVGMIEPFKSHGSLSGIVPDLQVRLCWMSLACFLVFVVIATYPLFFSEFKLEGY